MGYICIIMHALAQSVCVVFGVGEGTYISTPTPAITFTQDLKLEKGANIHTSTPKLEQCVCNS